MKLYLSIILILIFSVITFGQTQTDKDKAISLYQQEDYQAAISVLQSVVTADKTDWSAWLYLGMCFVKTDQKKPALQAFRQGVAAKPKKLLQNTDGFEITSHSNVPPTQESLDNHITGTVVLVVEFRADGKIGTIFPVKSLAGGLTESSIDAARKIKFKPMLKDGKPITSIKIMEYSFDIN